MACLPQITGGRLFNARTAEQIAANIEEALRLAGSEAVAHRAAARATGGPADPAAERSGHPRRWAAGALSARPARADHGGGEPAAELGRLRRGEARSRPVRGPRGEPVRRRWRPAATSIEVRDGPVFASQSVEVGDKEPTAANLVLNAGTLLVRAQAQKSGAPLGDAIVAVSDAGQAAEGKKDAAVPPLAMFKGSEGLAAAPRRALSRARRAGPGARRAVRRRARREPGSGRGTAQCRAPAGVGRRPRRRRVRQSRSCSASSRTIRTRRRAGARWHGPPPGRPISCSRPAPITSSRGRAARRRASAWRSAQATWCGARSTSPRAVLRWRPSLGAAPHRHRVSSSPTAWSASTASAPEVITTSRAAPVLVLPGGRYRVEGRYGAMNARTVRDIEVKAGQTQQLTLEPQAAALRLRLVANGAPVLSDVLWDIRDETGATVWTTGQPEPSAVLQAGRYAVRAETRDKRYDRAIELQRGRIAARRAGRRLRRLPARAARCQVGVPGAGLLRKGITFPRSKRGERRSGIGLP